MAYGVPKRGVYFLILDSVPDYIQKTFNLTPEGYFRGAMPQGVVAMLREGDTIPDGLDFAVIIYHTSTYHSIQAGELMQQLESLFPGVMVVGIPVIQG